MAMHNLDRTVCQLAPLVLLAGGAVLAMLAGCAERPAKPPGVPADSTGRFTDSAATRDDSAIASAGRAVEPDDQGQINQTPRGLVRPARPTARLKPMKHPAGPSRACLPWMVRTKGRWPTCR